MATQLPLLALRAFVEVGRLGSIKAAASALNVTPGAVSQQIRILEDRTGMALFMRERHGLRLTEAGESAYPSLLQAFEQIERATQILCDIKGRQTLSVSTVATFAASWLVPRLGKFTQRYPNIEVRIEATSDVVDMQRGRVDVALRHGLGGYPRLYVEHLMAPVLVPVACPGLINTNATLKEPEDCLDYPLLHDANRADWPLWLTAHNVAVDSRAERGTSFEDDNLLIRAAESGQGLALVPLEYAQAEIADGRLVQVLDKPWPSKFAYYIVAKHEAMQRSEVRAFVEWVIEEARQEL
ncbi:LysR family transcriptional regulator [Serratia rubidaea]|nr:LysR family transcriptional regulator [Serratia rubidaea]